MRCFGNGALINKRAPKDERVCSLRLLCKLLNYLKRIVGG